MKILTTLKRALELVGASRSSVWAGGSLEEIAAQLRAAIAAVESRTLLDRDELRVLFAPTGPLQELSIDNGWGDEFLSLAQQVDAFLADS
jgi:hypothetical protein